jgi:hypothetical protein
MTVSSEISLFVLLALPFVSAQTMPLKVDHVPICVAELAPVQRAFAALGLTPDYGGPHAGAGTHMALLGFDDGSYFELLAPQTPGSAEKSPEAKLLAASAGPCMWAVATSDIKSELKRLHELGITTDRPFPGGRIRPDGHVLKWETAGIGPGSRGNVLPFLIQDYTPHNLRVQPSVSVRGSALSGVAIVMIGVKDLTTTIALFRKAYGWNEPVTEEHKELGARLAHFTGTPVVLATPTGGDTWLAQRLEKFGDGPVAALVAARDWNAVAKTFPLTGETIWFGKRVAWFDPGKLQDLRIGVIASAQQIH